MSILMHAVEIYYVTCELFCMSNLFCFQMCLCSFSRHLYELDRMEELVRGLRGPPGHPGVGKPGRMGRPGKQGIPGTYLTT